MFFLLLLPVLSASASDDAVALWYTPAGGGISPVKTGTSLHAISIDTTKFMTALSARVSGCQKLQMTA